MARWLNLTWRLAMALWRSVWNLEPHYCLRHWRDVALRRYGHHDYGDLHCPRCKPGAATPRIPW